ncbi:hypothetical protein Tco_1312088 [Tanacetum coccineum]
MTLSRYLDAQINIMKVLNVGSTVGSFDKQALETELTQLKDAITSVRIQNDGFKAENVNLKRHYEELSKSNAYSRSTFTAKINALTAENAKLKTELSGKKSSGPSTSEKPKVLASGMYTKRSKYIPPPKRANWVKPTPLPKKKQVTFPKPPRTLNRPTQKPPVQQNKKPNVPVNLSTRTKPATESRKPMPKSHTRNHHILTSKSVNARKAADHNKKLHVVDHNQFVIRSLKSVNTKTPQAKHSVNHTKKVWKATRNHNVNTTKTAWRPTGKVVGSVKPQWKPTGRHFALYDNCPLTRIMEPIVEPLELTPSVSSSSKVTMISRFPDCKLSDRKAGSKGISGLLRTASIRKSDTSVLEDLKALSWKTCQEGSLLNLSDHSKYEHVGPKFSEWRIEEKITSNSRKSEIKMKLSNLVIQVSKIEFLQKHKCKTKSRDMEVDSVEEVKAEFEKLIKQLDTYVPMNLEATKESLKRFGEELQTKTVKKLKFDDESTQPTEEKVEEDKDDKPTKKTRKRRKQIARKGLHTDLDKDDSEDSDEASEKDDSTSGIKIPINHVPVVIKSPNIASYKIIKQGRKGVYQIVRENGSDKVYISFGAMLTDISRDDLTELYKIVMRKHGMNEPEDEFG